ncbi:MAG TPA: ATP-binding protein [Pseudonocardiaceae bacterium]|jgi:signal transduction histidine kinase|nr:ATP-binding protein [Pseudonocardiaceae bacterium]
MGMLLVAVGITWYVADLQFSGNPVIFRLGFWLYHLNVVILAHLLLAYPKGRLTRRPERITVAALYVTSLVTQGLRLIAEERPQPQGWGDPKAEYSIWAPIGSIGAILLTIVVVTLIVRRWRTEPRGARRAHALFWVAVILIGAVVALSSVAALVHVSVGVQGVLLLFYALAQLLLGVAVLIGSLREQLAHRRISRFAAEMERPRVADLESLRGRLADALEDQSLTLHFVRQNPDGSAEYVDLHGRPAPLPPEDDDRMITYVGSEQEPLAVLVHARFLTQQPQQFERLTAVTKIAGLALENASLHAAQQAHLRDVIEVEEATERATLRRIESMLHDGPQHRLSTLQLLLGIVQSRYSGSPLGGDLVPVVEELQGVVDDLRSLAQGVYPAALQGGLGAGLEALAQRSPVPLVIDVPRQLRCKSAEETVYFLISETVGNAWKYADAKTITVRVREVDNQVIIEVTDDGRGGAAPSAEGSGLRRWRERASALGGTFELNSPRGSGTTLRVVLPCE